MLKANERQERILKEAWYLVENNATIRQTADKFGLSKSCVHEDMTRKLQKLHYQLYLEVRKVLNYNISVRAYRGGMASKRKDKK